jgi:hypothetical protein
MPRKGSKGTARILTVTITENITKVNNKLQQIFKCAKRNLKLTFRKNMSWCSKFDRPRVKIFNSQMKYSKLRVILTISWT